MAYENLAQALNRTLQSMPEYQELFGSTPNWRYFSDLKGNRYFWTTQKTWSKKFKENLYLAGIYKKKGKGSFELIKESYCDKRSEAKALARKWWENNK